MAEKQRFIQQAAQKAADAAHFARLQFNLGRYQQALHRGKSRWQQLEQARRIAEARKQEALAQLPELLETFERRFTANGGEVQWARTAEEARRIVIRLMKEEGARTVVKGKSMVSEELHLNETLEAAGCEVWETDLGEFIVQLAGEKPYHIVTPAMHKSKEDVAALFARKLGLPENLTPQQLTMAARRILRRRFRTADAGITGANFIVPDVGGILLLENEGNIRLSTALPPLHIAIVGIEKVIPRLHDLALLLPLLATYGTGQRITNYNTLLTGPRRAGEKGGPRRMVVILLDNGRSTLYHTRPQSDALRCIRCGACLAVCPVYQTVGGHTYGTAYSGPIGSVISPFYEGFCDHAHISHASSLCGACTDICPVRIPLHELLLENRHRAAHTCATPLPERLAWRLWQWLMRHPEWLERVPHAARRLSLRLVGRMGWQPERAPLEPAPASFRRWWQKRRPS